MTSTATDELSAGRRNSPRIIQARKRVYGTHQKTCIFSTGRVEHEWADFVCRPPRSTVRDKSNGYAYRPAPSRKCSCLLWVELHILVDVPKPRIFEPYLKHKDVKCPNSLHTSSSAIQLGPTKDVLYTTPFASHADYSQRQFEHNRAIIPTQCRSKCT